MTILPQVMTTIGNIRVSNAASLNQSHSAHNKDDISFKAIEKFKYLAPSVCFLVIAMYSVPKYSFL